jgi:predicted acyl esterase
VTAKWNVQVPMRDGTALSADVYFADSAATPATTLLAHTPYNKIRSKPDRPRPSADTQGR